MGRKDTVNIILSRSSKYIALTDTIWGGRNIRKRHEKLEGLFDRTELLEDPQKMVTALGRFGIKTSLSVIYKDIELYWLVSESLSLKSQPRKEFLDEQGRKYGDKVPTLKCTFALLADIIAEIDIQESERKTSRSEPSVRTKAKSKSGEEMAAEIAKLLEENKNLSLELAETKKAAGQKALEVLRLNKDLADASRHLVESDKDNEELIRQLEVAKKDNASLAQKNKEISQEKARLDTQWEVNLAVLDRARAIIKMFEDLEEFFDELKKPLEIVDMVAKAPEDPKRLIDIISLMPKKMETDGKVLLPGPDLQKSVDPLDNEERAEVLEAIKFFTKVGGNQKSFCTRKLGESTEFSQSNYRLSLTASGRLGFIWLGVKAKGKPTTVYEVIHINQKVKED